MQINATTKSAMERYGDILFPAHVNTLVIPMDEKGIALVIPLHLFLQPLLMFISSRDNPCLLKNF